MPSASAQGPVKLAIVAEITGGGAPSGTMWRDAVILAVEDINKKGGILGQPLETFVQDTQTDPPTSVAVMRRAINDKPFAIFGTVYSSSTVANMEIARQAGIPQFSGSESVLVVTKGNDNIFLTSFSQEVGMAKLVRWLADDLKAEKIALIWVNNAFGKGGRDMFVQFLKDRGKTLVADISTEVQQADFTAELTKVRASGATHVMVYSHEEENARFMIQLRKIGLTVEPVGDNLCAQTTITPGGEAVNGARCHVGLTARLAGAADGRHEQALPGEIQPRARPQRLQGLHRRAPAQGGRRARGRLGPGQGPRAACTTTCSRRPTSRASSWTST